MSRTHIPAVLRRLVEERAGGRCEYCVLPELATFFPHDVDHMVTEKHGGTTIAENLALGIKDLVRGSGRAVYYWIE